MNNLVVIEIKGVKLTVAEARDVWQQLGLLFGSGGATPPSPIFQPSHVPAVGPWAPPVFTCDAVAYST